MAKILGCFVLVGALLCSVAGGAQFPGLQQPQGERVDADVALDRALKASSLTFEGKPFHAVMEIGTAGTPYSGRVEVWWVNATKYRVAATSPEFSQVKTVNGDKVEEKDSGDYFPRWLEDFVDALIDPVPMAKNFRGRGGAVMLGAQITRSCLQRDDRPGGVTDQLTWGQVCFSGAQPHVGYVLTFNHSMTFEDWKGFGKKQVARRYETDVLDYKPVEGRLVALEELKSPDESIFAVPVSTPLEQRIATTLVSTLQEESMVEHAPVIEWPSVREGKTDGYMIVYARTDRTGQVRETAKHNSDQPGLESYGMEQALKYKFKPLMVDGVAEQMEMPLVLHFTSRLGDPIPILTVEEMQQQMVACKVGTLPAGTPKGTVVTIRVAVNEVGKMTGMGPVGAGNGVAWIAAMQQLEGCRFAPYLVNGAPTYYKGDVKVAAP